MNFVIGLGNPGGQYHATKHNFGFWIIDKLIEERSLKIKAGKGDFVFAKDINNIFIKPTSFMNNSGIAIKEAMNYYKVESVENIIIIYDDIDISLGNIRFKSNGSDGGHNGIKSIIYQLNTDKFSRLKIGIATDVQMRPSEVYVLKPFPKKFTEEVDKVINHATNAINYYLEHGIKESMNEFNKKDAYNE